VLLRVEDVSFAYGPIQALKRVSLEVKAGEIVTIIGSNGAGKTSTLMCISGVYGLQSGRILFEGKDISSINPCLLPCLGLAQVPEGRKIFPRLTVLENLELGAFSRAKGADLSQDFEKVYSLFPILEQRKKQLGGTLSGGEQQMLAIGRALMSRPKLLLMDEPSMGVAPILVEKIFETIQKLNAEGLTVLLVEQNAHLALKLANRAYVLETGEVALHDSASALLSNPKIRELYLGES